jgi:geranylgeranyl transferase type-1 subunit beta
MAEVAETSFNRKNLTKYLHHMLNILPTPYASQESNRLTLMYFVVGALELLGELDNVDKKRLVDFVYSLQVLPDKDDFGKKKFFIAVSHSHRIADKNIQNCGFRGGNSFGNPWNPSCVSCSCITRYSSACFHFFG